MSGVTHSRAVERETPVLFEMHEQVRPRSRRDRLQSEYDEVMDHRRIYLEALGRFGLKPKKRAEYQKKLVPLTTRALELERELFK